MMRPVLFACVLASAGLAPGRASAQTLVQAPAGAADQLAAQMRILAGNANDLSALLTAGELSVKLEDLGAAASFFARAEKIDPHNGRAKAGEGAILVHAERPGEALRYFVQAEGYGAAPASFAADRGLAYDLIGEQERAQRDYRLALRAAPDEETQRRYALSLAIAGKRELADQELQPLLRQSDRGAWRARAFVLALGGNVAEAERIATTMMPPGTAAGLQPFLEKLPTLATVDRAFAVHFGEIRSTPERVADARRVPALAALGPDPYAPRVAVAVVPDKGKRRNEGKRRGKREPVQVAVAAPAPEPLPQAPAYRPTAGAPAVLATRGAAPAAWPTAITPEATLSRAQATLAARSSSRANTVSPSTTEGSAPAASLVGTTAIGAGRAEGVSPAPTQVLPPPRRASAPPAAPPPETTVIVAAAPVRDASPPVPAPRPSTVVAAPPGGAVPTAWPTAITPSTPPPSLAAKAPPAEDKSATAEPAKHVVGRRDDTALSRIVAGLPIPAAELGVTPPADVTPSDPAAEKAAAAKALADKRAVDRKAAADRKALADKKAAAAKKAEEDREAAAQKKLERANPERIWVQVAGGANQRDLAKAWAAAKTKGGDVFAGHATGWTTPLRFTNRVLAGPFKTDDDARAFVNKAKGAGLSAFVFTSDAGQVVTKLSAK